MSPAELTMVERFGSFGLVVLVVGAGVYGAYRLATYVKDELIPRAFAYVEAKDKQHASERREEREATLLALGRIGDRLSLIETKLEDR